MDEIKLNSNPPTLSNFFNVIYKWKKFIFINIVVVVLLLTIIAFSLTEYFKSTAVIMIPEETASSLGGLSGLIGGKSSSISMGAKLFGISNTSEDLVLGLLHSRTALTNVIQKFDLRNYYDNQQNIDKVLRAFKADLLFEPNEFGMIELSVINKNPKIAAAIANYFVTLLDSMNLKINAERARNNRIFIENRYKKNIADLKTAEDSMYRFQKKYGMFSVPEQLEASVKAAAEIERELVSRELAMTLAELQLGVNSPQYSILQEEVNLLKRRVSELKDADKLSDISNVLFPFKHIPEITLNYFRIYREIEIQSTILEVILPMYEQAKVEEQKSIPTIMVIDKAYPAQLKDSPKRMLLIGGISSCVFFLLLFIVIRANNVLIRDNLINEFEKKEVNIYSSLVRFYRLKI